MVTSSGIQDNAHSVLFGTRHLDVPACSTFGSVKQNLFPTPPPPPQLDASLPIDGLLNTPLISLVNQSDQPSDRLVPGYRSVRHLLPLEASDFASTFTSTQSDNGVPYENESYAINENYDEVKQRKRRNAETPFYTVGVGTVFDADRYFEVSYIPIITLINLSILCFPSGR
ncbi:unnamed protein product [Trichobilharzia regenti]|nr:unnamed protein product [Trichobilharzia regenti]